MVVVYSRKLTFTLLCNIALAFLFISLVTATDSFSVNRREHVARNKMLKKRADPFGLDPVQNVGGGPSDTAVSSTTAPSATADQASSTAPPALPTTLPLATASLGLTDSAAGATSSTSAGLSASSSPSIVSSTALAATTSNAVASSAPATATAPTTLSAVGENGDAAEGVTITSHIQASATAGASSPPAPKGSSNLSHGAITVLIVIASCVGGGAIVWTIFRKWKLRASSRFEDRLEPISWQPTSDGDNGLPGQNRRASVASSFHSAGHDGLMRSNSSGASTYGATGGYGTTGQSSLAPLPDHDFTAGANHLTPIGGYADLSRGPSPQPQMHDLHRGPSFNNAYEYGAPTYHQDGAMYDRNASRY